MSLGSLSVTDFRNLAQVQISPLEQGFNFFYGHNGSGKTSLLEAIYYLGHRRSFRGVKAERLIRQTSERFNLFSKICDHAGAQIPLGMERSHPGEVAVRLNGQNLTAVTELASVLPMRLINVHSHHLLEGAPVFRRKFLDWGLFYQHPEFHLTWFRFKRLLRQRNAALRARVSLRELASWTEPLAEAATTFHSFRVGYLEALLPELAKILDQRCADFFDVSQLKTAYQPGWDNSLPYAEYLEAHYSSDLERGFTQNGPHRADLTLKFSRIAAKEMLSTGQQKLLVCGMILAQGALLAQGENRRLIYLVDDLPAELDKQSRRWLIQSLADQKAQIFVTAVEKEAMSEMLAQLELPVKMFHVKHGVITEDKD